MSRFQLYFKALVTLVLLLGGLTGCNLPGPGKTPAASPTSGVPASPSAPGSETTAPSPAPPTETAQPLAARVNGYEITLAEVDAELAQFQAANAGAELTQADRTRVLDALIDEALLAASALQSGFQMDSAQLQTRLQTLAEQSGGESKLAAWIQTHGHNQTSFAAALRRSAAAAWMRDQIIAGVPTAAEQIHARQILLYDADEAGQVYTQLQAGNDFGNLSVQYDPVTRGDLGWFPRGFLTDPKLDEAVFALQPPAYTAVIETAAGFHILQALEREVERPLSPEALMLAQTQALQTWLTEQRTAAQIENLLP